MIDGAHPFVMKLGCGRHADKADARALWIGGADEKFLAAGILDVLQRHFVDLKIKIVRKHIEADG